MRKIVAAAIVGLVFIAGAAEAQGDMTGVVRGRQAAMMMSGATLGGIKAAIDAGQAPSTQRFNTRALSRWAHALPGMFPAGSDARSGAPTNARAEVWSDRARFEAKAAEVAAAADRLAELSGEEDLAAFSAQWTVVRAGCQSCHDGFKS